jgi:hypothetical protein
MCCSRTTFERNELLRDYESRDIINLVKDNRTSLLSLRGTGSLSARMSIAPPSETWSLISKDFDFDQDVLNTEVYRAAWRSNMRNAARTWKGKISQVHEDELEETPTLLLTNEESTHATFYLPGPSDAAFSELPNKRQDGPPRLLPFPPQSLFKKGMHRVDDKNDEVIANTAPPTVPVKTVINGATISTSELAEARDLSIDLGLQPRTKLKSTGGWKLRIPKRLAVSDGLKLPKFVPLPGDAKRWNVAPLIPDETKILILGTSESGKSTFLKSTKLALEGGYSRDERENFKETIFLNMVQSMRIILEAMPDLEIALGDPRNEHHVRNICITSMLEHRFLTQRVSQAIEVLWKDGGVQEAFGRSREYQLGDATSQ